MKVRSGDSVGADDEGEMHMRRGAMCGGKWGAVATLETVELRRVYL